MSKIVRNITVYDYSELPDFGPGFEGHKKFCRWLYDHKCTYIRFSDDENPDSCLREAISAARIQKCSGVVMHTCPRRQTSNAGIIRNVQI